MSQLVSFWLLYFFLPHELCFWYSQSNSLTRPLFSEHPIFKTGLRSNHRQKSSKLSEVTRYSQYWAPIDDSVYCWSKEGKSDPRWWFSRAIIRVEMHGGVCDVVELGQPIQLGGIEETHYPHFLSFIARLYQFWLPDFDALRVQELPDGLRHNRRQNTLTTFALVIARP